MVICGLESYKKKSHYIIGTIPGTDYKTDNLLRSKTEKAAHKSEITKNNQGAFLLNKFKFLARVQNIPVLFCKLQKTYFMPFGTL